MDIHVTSEVMAAIKAAAEASYPKEACGILLGQGIRITGFSEACNVHPAPETHFEIDPQTLINVHRAARDGGLQVLGYFHSHPKGPASPSETDRAMAAADGAIWAIRGEGATKFYRAPSALGEGVFAELSMSPIES